MKITIELSERQAEAVIKSLTAHSRTGEQIDGDACLTAALTIQNAVRIAKEAAAKSTVYSKPECIFNYCPQPERCKEQGFCENPKDGCG